MTGYADLLLLAVLVLDLYVVYTSRLAACVRASALQGATLALLPVVHYLETPSAHLVHVLVMAASALAFKAIFIPRLLMRALRDAGVRRDVEPFVSLHLSVLLAGVLVGISFWLATVLALPVAGTTHLFVPTAFATFLIGFLVLVSRRKAITQVIGYLLIENGAYVFGQSLAAQMPFVVELGLLLDLLVGVFVMGIVIHQINREFDHIDVDQLNLLKG
ncbi:MAG: NADH-quinone oxidoreductase subunit K [Polyangia bacterium]